MSIRHDWYQSENKVVIDILIKNATSRNCTVNIKENSVSIRCDDIELDFELAHEIDTTKSTFRVLSMKIEVTLQKLAGERWSSLVKDKTKSEAVKVQEIPQCSTAASAVKPDKNWDRVVKEAIAKENIEQVSFRLWCTTLHDVLQFS